MSDPRERSFPKRDSPKDLPVTLRDFLAMMMPKPPVQTLKDPDYPGDEEGKFLAEVRARYAMADKIIGEVR